MIRPAVKGDLAEIFALYEGARARMAQAGNASQWGSTYPPAALVEEDVAKGRLYVLERKGLLCGVFMFAIGEDPAYRRIEEGAWLEEGPYGVIHRVAGKAGEKGVFDECLRFCRSRIAHLRIDTHRDNRVMQHVLEKNGFRRCGTVYAEDGTPRIAYELPA